MKCDKVKNLLPFLLDDSLEKDDGDQVRDHLKHCESCSREYNELKKLLGNIHTVLEPKPHSFIPGYIEMVQSRIARKKMSRSIYLRAMSAAAAAVFIISFAMYGLISRHTVETPEVNNLAMNGYTNLSSIDVYNEFGYITGDDLPELVEELAFTDEEIDDDTIVNTLYAYNYNNITPEDIVEVMDNEELELVFTSYER